MKKIITTVKIANMNDANYHRLNQDFLTVINNLIAKDLSFDIDKDGNEIYINVGHTDYQIYMLMLDGMTTNDYNITDPVIGRIDCSTTLDILNYINK